MGLLYVLRLPNSCGMGLGIYLEPLCDGRAKAGRNFFAAGGATQPPSLLVVVVELLVEAKLEIIELEGTCVDLSGLPA